MKKKSIIILISVLVLVAITLIAVDLLIPREGVNEKAINIAINKIGQEKLDQRNTFAYSIQKEDNVVKVITYDQASPFKLVLNYYLKDDKVTNATIERYYFNKLEAIVYTNTSDNEYISNVKINGNVMSGDYKVDDFFLNKTSAEVIQHHTMINSSNIKID